MAVLCVGVVDDSIVGVIDSVGTIVDLVCVVNAVVIGCVVCVLVVTDPLCVKVLESAVDSAGCVVAVVGSVVTDFLVCEVSDVVVADGGAIAEDAVCLDTSVICVGF